MSATPEQIADANRIPFPPTEREDLEAWRLYIDEAGRKNMAVRVPLEVVAALKKEAIPSLPTVPLTREEVDAAIAKGIPSLPTVRLAPQGLSKKEKQIENDAKKDNGTEKAQRIKSVTFPRINKGLPSTAGSRIERLVLYATSIAIHDSGQKQTEKDPQQNDETEKAQGSKLETFLKINKDLLSTPGSRIERLFLHAASIAIFAIWLVADKLNQRKKLPVELKTDEDRANRQDFRAKNKPLTELQQRGADLLRGQGLEKGQAKVACRSW